MRDFLENKVVGHKHSRVVAETAANVKQDSTGQAEEPPRVGHCKCKSESRSFPGRTSARSLSGRIESIWETPSKERAWPALQRSVLCKGACSAKERALQKSVLCKGACSAKKRALQRSVLCKGECSAKERALQRSVLCKEACSAKKRALQRRVLCKEACSAKERALQRRVLCKEACSAKESALQRSVESALQRSVLCKEACSVFTAPREQLMW